MFCLLQFVFLFCYALNFIFLLPFCFYLLPIGFILFTYYSSVFLLHFIGRYLAGCDTISAYFCTEVAPLTVDQ